jgi:transposase
MSSQEFVNTGLGISQGTNSPIILGSQPIGAPLHPRLAWMLCYEETGSVQEVADRFNISRKTFYKWYKRYKNSGGSPDSLTDRSRKPHHSPRATSADNVQLLKMVKEETGFGQRRLRTYLEQKYQVRISERTIWKILKQQDGETTGKEAKA